MQRSKQRQSLICSRNCETNNFLAILELCTFYIEYKTVKFKAINFTDQTNVKYFMQAQLLWFCKDTAKVSSPSYVTNNFQINIFPPHEGENTNTVDRNSNK